MDEIESLREKRELSPIQLVPCPASICSQKSSRVWDNECNWSVRENSQRPNSREFS